MMKIEPASQDDVHHVAMGMRDRDLAEFLAVSYAQDRASLAHTLALRYGDRSDVMCGFRKGNPVCIGGTIEARPNVLTLLFFATEEFRHVALPATRFIRDALFPRVRDAGVHRIEAVSMVGHEETHRWLRTLGLAPETEAMRGYGKNGEAFIQFSWVR